MKSVFSRADIDIAWCPGCGNFGILNLLKRALEELGVDKKDVVFVSGIGQAAKTPHYLDTNLFDGLHGRALPVATAIKAANPNLIVIAEGGDGDMYGEGGNHFLSAVRRNVNIIHVVHNNMVYGLTKGQASPTSQRGFKTKVQVGGVHNEPFNPIATALALNGSFVSRIYVGMYEHAMRVLKEAFLHRGYALVDIFQPCVTFNKINTYDWFKQNCEVLGEEYRSDNIEKAFAKSLQNSPFPLGVFYKEERPTFEDELWSNYEQKTPLYSQIHNSSYIQKMFDKFK